MNIAKMKILSARAAKRLDVFVLFWAVMWGAALTLLYPPAQVVHASFEKNAPSPVIVAEDIYGNPVSTEEILNRDRKLVILFFFSLDTSEELALRLDHMNKSLGGVELEIVALGLREDADALKDFAEAIGIEYYLISRELLEDADWRAQVDVLPTTLFVIPKEGIIERVLRGDQPRHRNILAQVAENFYQQRVNDAALQVADQALETGEDPREAREIRGYILASEGLLDEAEAEFGAIDAQGGLSQVAYERGDWDRVLSIAGESDDAYAQTMKGQALLRLGDLEEAGRTLETARSSDAPTRDWQRAELENTRGRVVHESGDVEAATETYREAVDLDPYNVKALSNTGAALQEQGRLEEAEAVLQRASGIREDEMVVALLQQVQQQLQEANDVERRQLIQSQISELGERYAALRASGEAEARDDWSSRPLVMALLPGNRGSVYFERAGVDVVLQRSLEQHLQQDAGIQVLERGMLDLLLQELNLGSSDLANPDTQRRLGQVLSAGMLGFMEYSRIGGEAAVLMRVVDTETTAILWQQSLPFDERHPLDAAAALAEEIRDAFHAERDLQGLVAEVLEDGQVIINLGSLHGVTPGQRFLLLEDGDPIEVGGRVIAHRQRPIGHAVVDMLESNYAICRVENLREDATPAPEMKLKSIESQTGL